MFQTIILGIDGRPQDAEAHALATRLGEPGAEIIAAKIAVIDDALLRAAGAAHESALLADSEDVVDAFTETRVRTEGVVTSAASVGRGLAELADGAGADLIVVASSRRGLAGRVFAGDAVRDVLRHAPCPVAVATVGHGAGGPLEHVVVGYDGGPESTAALDAAVRVARRDAATIRVVEVVEPTFSVEAVAGGPVGDSVEEGVDRASRHLRRVLETYGLHGAVTVGRAAHELARVARGADLLAIGLRDHGLLDRLLVGSTAHALLREQCAPLLVVPPVVRTKAIPADSLDSRPSTTSGAPA